VELKRTINRALVKATGYQLERAASGGGPREKRRAAVPQRRRTVGELRGGDRLLERPTFILCTLRSGSTLLRVLLNSHSQIHAPHEMHLRYVSVKLDAKWAVRSMRELGLDPEGLEYLLWDRILHRELATSGKPMIVDKTPNNVFIADRLRACWPDARFIFLLRHPASIARSRQALRPEDADNDANIDLIRRYCEALERARQTHEGHTVRYEELTADPAAVTQGICRYLGIPWEPTMLDYGQHEHGRFRAGLGDWADKIKTGQIQRPEPPPEDTPAPLREVAAAWGYLKQPSEAVTPG
jgi:LPS sulfotransferase NodH